MNDSGHWPQRAEVAVAELLCAPCCALASLIGARVAVETVGDAAAQEGLLHSVDPETRTLVLLEGCVSAGEGDELHAPTVSVVLAHALVRLTVLCPSAACEVPDFCGRHLRVQRSSAQSTSMAPPPYEEAEALRRRTAVADALTKHRIPWEQTGGGGLLVLGCLTLVWPFTADAATCPNSRVLEQVTALLDAALGQPGEQSVTSD